MQSAKALVSSLFHDPVAKIWSLARTPFPVLAPGAVVVKKDELERILKAALGEVQIYTDDKRYALLDLDRLKRVLCFDGTRRMTFRSERNDCDNYAALARARVQHYSYLGDVPAQPAFGQISGLNFVVEGKKTGSHRMNVVVTSKKKVLLYEPQNGNFYKPKFESLKFILI
jgi:hypothetical protein